METWEEANPEEKRREHRASSLHPQKIRETWDEANPEDKRRERRTSSLPPPKTRETWEEDPKRESTDSSLLPQELTPRLLIAAVLPSLGYFQTGFNSWVVLSPEMVTKTISNITGDTVRVDLINKDPQNNQVVYNTIAYPIGGILGSLILGIMVDNIGRKNSLILNNITSAVACGFLSASVAEKLHNFGILARFLIGISSGLFYTMIPLYIGEIAPINIRGALTMMPIEFFTMGVLSAQIISHPRILGYKKALPLMLSLPGIVAVLNIPLMLLCPESPRYLFIQKKNEKTAKIILQKLRGKEDVEDEIEELRNEREYEKQERDMTIFKLLRNDNIHRQVISLMMLMGGQQFSGIMGLMPLFAVICLQCYFYADKIYEELLTEASHGFYVKVAGTCWLIIVASVMIIAIDSVGRRFLLLLGFLICAFATVFLTLTLELRGLQPWLIYVSAIFVFVMLAGYMLGPAIITYVVTVEMFLQSSRAAAFTLGGFVNWIARCASVVIFLKLEPLAGPYCLLILWPFCLVTFVYISMNVPESGCVTFLRIRQFLDLQALEDKQQAR